jgi:outer membrane protein assembly factor BamB
MIPGFLVGSTSAGASAHEAIIQVSKWDWPSFGYSAQHTFDGRSTLTEASAKTLKQAWFFPTGDAVTATPTVVDGTVYVGSWDRYFYAIDLATGKLTWKYRLSDQNAVTPYPGQNPRNYGSDGGLVTSSAWFEPGNGSTRPNLVIFGGGYTLYALNAETGALFWRHDYTGRPFAPPNPNKDGTRIFSSPVVADGLVLFGVDVDGQPDSRGYVVGANLSNGKPAWIHQTAVNAAGKVLNDGCGNVWSSGSVMPAVNEVVFDEADCDFTNRPLGSETIFALDISTGHLAWTYRPTRVDRDCDWDFGATVNIGLNRKGVATFLGVGGKDGTYYSLNPKNGKLRWKTNVVFGGFAGGFIATLAYNGTEVVGSTAIGDFGDFESNGTNRVCDPGNPRDVAIQQPSAHAFDAATGAILWQENAQASFGATTIANTMSLNGEALGKAVQVRDIKSGMVIVTLPLPAPAWGGIATVGDSIVFGTGASEQGSPDGVYAYTPDGATPSVPGESG